MAGIVVGLSPRRTRGAVARGDAAAGRAPRGERDFPAGSVCLVGAGPGDPGLLTLRAAARLGAADVVYHDALVGEGVLALCRPARLVPVGKRRRSVLSQEATRRRSCPKRAGWRVVRLKGGDPLVRARRRRGADADARRRLLRDRPRTHLRQPCRRPPAFR
jgi:hypothetical protein